MARLDLGDYGSQDSGSVNKSGESESSLESDFFAGVPDEFQRLWTPHRLVYIKNGQQPEKDDCPFCYAPEHDSKKTLVVRKSSHAFVVLNLFPYNSGHLLVCPYRHIGTYDQASAEEIADIGLLTQQAMHVLRYSSKAHGFNIGMNQGEVAGAGIAGHLHQHIVPRWSQDANFFPIIAKTKALPIVLGDIWNSVNQAWSELYG